MQVNFLLLEVGHKHWNKFAYGIILIGSLQRRKADYVTYLCKFDLSLGFERLERLELELLVVLLYYSIIEKIDRVVSSLDCVFEILLGRQALVSPDCSQLL